MKVVWQFVWHFLLGAALVALIVWIAWAGAEKLKLKIYNARHAKRRQGKPENIYSYKRWFWWLRD